MAYWIEYCPAVFDYLRATGGRARSDLRATGGQVLIEKFQAASDGLVVQQSRVIRILPGLLTGASGERRAI